ncbi:MAG: nicotinate-nucleotide adenylyltransferase [Rhodocyclaceae bacterium]|nr:nicotinate-nucleotide adenylyltransferase [Rhodocyclaceae bacterium]
MGAPLGILGGTFDPVHLAHVALARAALDRLNLAQVVWIPAGQPPHRDRPRTPADDRLAMVRMAIAGEPRFALDASEVASTAPSYTMHTLERLRREYGASRPLVLLMGADAFRGLPGWHRWQEIFGLAHIAVATRPDFPLDAFAAPLADEFIARRLAGADFSSKPAGGIHTFELVAGTVSATAVRGLVAAGAPDEKLRELVPAPVLDYIRQHQLYRP